MPNTFALDESLNTPARRELFPVFHIFSIVLLWSAVYLSALFQPPLLDDADSVHAEAAREMLLNHDWVTLHVNGIRYLEKAPLMYWAIAGSFRLFGIHDWSARLPLALGVLVLMLAVYFFGSRHFSKTAGFYASVCSGLSFGPYIFTRFLIPDVLVGLWLVLSFDLFLRTLDDSRPSLVASCGLGLICALNVLTKGLIGLVFPLTVCGIFLLVTHNLRHLNRLQWSVPVFFLFATPWHVLAGLRNPDQGGTRGFFWFYFINEHVLRYLGQRIPRDYGTVPIVLFWGLILIWLFPWSCFLPEALLGMPIFRARPGDRSHEQRCRMLLLLGAFTIVFFFSFSTRQEYYVLPALPLLSLLIGERIAQEQLTPANSPLHRRFQIAAGILAAIGLLVFVLSIILVVLAPTPPGNADIATLLHSGPPESSQYALSLGHFLDLNLPVMRLFRVPLLLFSSALFMGSLLYCFFQTCRRLPSVAYAALTGMSVCLLIAVHQALVIFSPILTSQPLADAIQRVERPGDVIEISGEYEGASTLNYYTGRQVRILNGRSANLWYGSLFPDAPQIFDDTNSFRQLWTSDRRIFLWTDLEGKDSLLQSLSPPKPILFGKSGDKMIFINHPLR